MRSSHADEYKPIPAICSDIVLPLLLFRSVVAGRGEGSLGSPSSSLPRTLGVVSGRSPPLRFMCAQWSHARTSAEDIGLAEAPR
jgi:hypothetical protein